MKVDTIDIDIIKEMRALAPMTVNVCLKARFSKWQRLRLWIGMRCIIWGCKLTGLRVVINMKVNTDESNQYQE